MAMVIEMSSDERYEFCHTALQRKLQRAADRLLAKCPGFFEVVEECEDEYIPLNAECIPTSGNTLRPVWHGKA